MNDGPLIFRAIYSVLGFYAAIYLVTAISAPRWFLDTIAITHIERRRNRNPNNMAKALGDPWWVWPWILFTFLSIFVFAHAAVYPIITVIPYLADYGAEGELERLRDATVCAMPLAYVLASRLEKNAELLVWARHERIARGAIITSLRNAKGMTRELREKIASVAEKELEPDPLRLQGYELDYAKSLRTDVGYEIRR